MARRSGLGRGLGALMGETAGEVTPDGASQPVSEVPVTSVEPNPNQPRTSFDEEELQALTDSVSRDGILQPLVVRRHGAGYQIVAGERRYQAARRAGLETVPVVVREVSDDEMLRLALIENLQRSDLDPVEEALGYQALIERHGVTRTELGQMLSKSRSSVSNALRLLDLPQEVLDLVRAGTLSAGHARAILGAQDDEARCALARKVVADGLSVRQTEILAPLFFVKTREESTAREPMPESYKSAARTLRKELAAKVRVRTVRGRHKIEIEFADDEELGRLVQRIVEVRDAHS